MHENFHKNVNENMFSFTFLRKFSLVFTMGNLKQQICYSFVLCLMDLKWWSISFRLHQNFPILMVQMLFFQNLTGFRKVGKSLFSQVLGYLYALGDEGQGKKSYYAVLNGLQRDKPVFGGLQTMRRRPACTSMRSDQHLLFA